MSTDAEKRDDIEDRAHFTDHARRTPEVRSPMKKYQHNGTYHSIIRARTEMLCDFVRAYPAALDARWHEVKMDFHAWALCEGIDTSNLAYRMTRVMSNQSYGAVKKYIRKNCISA